MSIKIFPCETYAKMYTELADERSMECPYGQCTNIEVLQGKCSCCLPCQNNIIRELSSDKDNNPHPLIYSSGKA